MSDSSINMKGRAVTKVACSLHDFDTVPNEFFKADILLFVSSGTFVLNGWNLSGAVYKSPWYSCGWQGHLSYSLIRGVTQTESSLSTHHPEVMAITPKLSCWSPSHVFMERGCIPFFCKPFQDDKIPLSGGSMSIQLLLSYPGCVTH